MVGQRPLTLQRKNKKHCTALLKKYREWLKTKGIRVKHVYGNSLCAWNCFCLLCHLADLGAEDMRIELIIIIWLMSKPAEHRFILESIDEITGRHKDLDVCVFDEYKADMDKPEVEIHMVLLPAYHLNLPLLLIAPVYLMQNMVDHEYTFNANEVGFWFIDSKLPNMPVIYMSFEPLTNT
jgi:hypothetical protein